jgi:hypothetical protein
MESWSDHPWLKLVVGARNQIEMAREGRPGYGMKLSPLVDVCFAALAINIKKEYAAQLERVRRSTNLVCNRPEFHMSGYVTVV